VKLLKEGVEIVKHIQIQGIETIGAIECNQADFGLRFFKSYGAKLHPNSSTTAGS
jgi:hypothetical protein